MGVIGRKHRNSAIRLCFLVLFFQIRLDSTDTNAKVVADCSGNSCEPIKVGMVCMPGSEEYCIGGHMPNQEDAVVGDHSTVTPGQYSRINTESKEGQQEAKSEEKA